MGGFQTHIMVSSPKLLYHFIQFGMSQSLWPWPKLVACPVSQADCSEKPSLKNQIFSSPARPENLNNGQLEWLKIFAGHWTYVDWPVPKFRPPGHRSHPRPN